MHCFVSSQAQHRFSKCQAKHNIKKQSYSGCFLYDQINHHDVLYLQEQAACILRIHVSLLASDIQANSRMNSHSNEYCSTGLEL